ncbi:hypothetical protein DKG75_20205 [Zavarzinia compransoris]|uniref:Uncharacterized protein n=1 Tax=Zavarzinia compransoris TaxID=1264899 RepID=A0A317DZI2_9PROT|nr:hypothetical protein DKG75_20205 [Zavarzinia compransoris]
MAKDIGAEFRIGETCDRRTADGGTESLGRNAEFALDIGEFRSKRLGRIYAKSPMVACAVFRGLDRDAYEAVWLVVDMNTPLQFAGPSTCNGKQRGTDPVGGLADAFYNIVLPVFAFRHLTQHLAFRSAAGSLVERQDL